MKIEIGDKKYNVSLAVTELDKEKGLQGKEKLDKNEGMLFVYEEPLKVSFWMQDTEIPLDIVFIGDDYEVISVHKGKPLDETPITEDEVLLVLEVNQDSGIKPGDELEMDEEHPTMKVLLPDGSVLMELEGGERIVSRRETKILIKKAKAAYRVKNDAEQYSKKCKSLGKYMFKVLKKQNERQPEYVESPK